ncbi:class I SAM-dependent methyltransferase [Candidatus Nitrospira salsa]
MHSTPHFLIKNPEQSTTKPHPMLNDYYALDSQRQSTINQLFDQVAPDYYWISQALSFGSGNWHRTNTLRQSGFSQGMNVLDVACGPGTVARCAQDLVKPEGYVVGHDPSRGMLQEAKKNGLRRLSQGLAEHLPFQDSIFDRVTMGYALRHVSDLQHTFTEYFRVLKPGGRVLILEISRPRSLVQMRLAKFFLKTIIPRIARYKTRNQEALTIMEYFWDTIEHCVSPEIILTTLKRSGFSQVNVAEFCGGLIKDYHATKL